MPADIATYRGPDETDVSLAGRGGISPKTLYAWKVGDRLPRLTTWQRVTQRWRESRYMVDPDAAKVVGAGRSPVGGPPASVAPAIHKTPTRRAADANSVQPLPPLAPEGHAGRDPAEQDRADGSPGDPPLAAEERQMHDDHALLVTIRNLLNNDPQAFARWRRDALRLATDPAFAEGLSGDDPKEGIP